MSSAEGRSTVCLRVLFCLVCLLHFTGGAGAASTRPNVEDVKPNFAPEATVVIPGPLRSFLRMAAMSQKIAPDEVLPLLARNIYMQGYQNGHETEFLRLLTRYVSQARELQILAGVGRTIRVANCNDAGTLIQILGYRLRQGCGQSDVALETANPERAFLTIDSGFPLTELEEALQQKTPFVYAYADSVVPILYEQATWMDLRAGEDRSATGVVDLLLSDPAMARLYWALAKEDAETRNSLQRSAGLKKLLPFAATLDFYGGEFAVRSGHVHVPGGPDAESAWSTLVGASPDAPADFILHLLAKDGGWLAAYFDVLSRVNRNQQDHLTQAPRLERFYEAFRTPSSEPGATRSVYRKDAELLVLFTRVQWETNGEPHIPGGMDAWREILLEKTNSPVVRSWGKRARTWSHPEQLLQAMVAFSHIETDDGPLQSYLMLSEIDNARRPEDRLSAATVRLVASHFPRYNRWCLIFSEFPELNDVSIARFMEVADGIGDVKSAALRGNVLGSFQANVGLWQILSRQREIPAAALNESWQKMVEPFAKIASSTQLFDAARTSLGEILLVADGGRNQSQDEAIDLLAGPRQNSQDGQNVHRQIADKMHAVMQDQCLISFSTLFALSDGLHGMMSGGVSGKDLLASAGELQSCEMPRRIFTEGEKTKWAPEGYLSHHAELQMRGDLLRVLQGPASRAQLEAARGRLAPFLRDTLVGLNYAYYEPPGAQILHTNSLFVRSHNFMKQSPVGVRGVWDTPILTGVGSSASGGAYLSGSLADLSHALAGAEQSFIAPENVQALVFQELVPDLLLSATLPRWWNVSPHELHAVGLYQQSGAELLAASVGNVELRSKVIHILTDGMTPKRLEVMAQAMTLQADLTAMLPQITPQDMFYLGVEFRKRFPAEAVLGRAGRELEDLVEKFPDEVRPERLARDFGVPHPTLARTYLRELLNVKPFPFFGGSSSHLFGESWESSNLYWASLADEKGFSPVMLNLLIPELTRRMTARIFATNLEDWPSMLRAMQETGEEFRQGKIVPLLGVATNTPARTVSEPHAE